MGKRFSSNTFRDTQLKEEKKREESTKPTTIAEKEDETHSHANLGQGSEPLTAVDFERETFSFKHHLEKKCCVVRESKERNVREDRQNEKENGRKRRKRIKRSKV